MVRRNANICDLIEPKLVAFKFGTFKKINAARIENNPLSVTFGKY